ncbi:histidine phosphatase family protein, partial [Candidatus Woesearchaeota archaeon]|nr:histidine phosphatase family protein [Candidatus Woesearchaeota archaeon]
MRLIIVRHGETVENVTGISQGQTHGTLSDKGIEQARKVAQRLKDEKIDHAYSSDLGRARHTTEEIMKYHQDVPVEYTAQLRELGKGELDGKPRKLREEAVKKSEVPFHEYKFEGGESLIEVRERMIDFFENLKKKHHNQTVLIVGHGGSLSCLFLHLENKGLEHRKEYYT